MSSFDGIPTIRPREPDPEAYKRYESQSWKVIGESVKSLDRNILTLSTGALAVSLTFVKELAKGSHPTLVYLLPFSWGCFISSMVTVLFSFQLSVWANEKSIDDAYQYYIQCESAEPNTKNKFSDAIDFCTYVSAALFFVGILLTGMFASSNLEGAMASNENDMKKVVMPELQRGLKPMPLKPVQQPDRPKQEKKEQR